MDKNQVTISDKALAICELQNELDRIEITQLHIAQNIHKLILQQSTLSAQCGAIVTTIRRIING